MPYEVDAADGRCLYRGYDLELACEIHDQLPTAHLRFVAPPRPRAGTPDRPWWKGPATHRRR
jgi:hypothetical protein